MVAPPPSPVSIKLVGRVVPQPRGTQSVVGGWRSFDVRCAHYNTELKKRLPFTTRWYFPANKRWANFQVPTVGTILQLAGKLLGRHRDKHPSELFPLLAIQVIALDFVSVRQQAPSEASASPTNAQSATPPPQRSSWARSSGLARPVAMPPSVGTPIRPLNSRQSLFSSPPSSSQRKGKGLDPAASSTSDDLEELEVMETPTPTPQSRKNLKRPREASTSRSSGRKKTRSSAALEALETESGANPEDGGANPEDGGANAKDGGDKSDDDDSLYTRD